MRCGVCKFERDRLQQRQLTPRTTRTQESELTRLLRIDWGQETIQPCLLLVVRALYASSKQWILVSLWFGLVVQWNKLRPSLYSSRTRREQLLLLPLTSLCGGDAPAGDVRGPEACRRRIRKAINDHDGLPAGFTERLSFRLASLRTQGHRHHPITFHVIFCLFHHALSNTLRPALSYPPGHDQLHTSIKLYIFIQSNGLRCHWAVFPEIHCFIYT